MRNPPVLRYVIAILTVPIVLSFTGPLFAAQVVTPDLRQWAARAVASEADLAFAPAANSVAVLYFHNRTGRPELDLLEKGMALMLITDLAKLDYLEVVERAQLQALAQELQLGASGLVDAQTAPRVGRLLGARHLVGGLFEGLPDDAIGIDASLLNVPFERLVGTADSAGVLEELLRMQKEILFEIVRLLGLELTDEEEEALRRPIAFDIQALMLLFEGIQRSDLGDYERAAAHYRSALDIEPDMEAAQAALEELVDLRLIRAPHDAEALLRHLHQQVSVNTGPQPNNFNRRDRFQPATAEVRVQW